jgi:hypothetical protein
MPALVIVAKKKSPLAVGGNFDPVPGARTIVVSTLLIGEDIMVRELFVNSCAIYYKFLIMIYFKLG